MVVHFGGCRGGGGGAVPGCVSYKRVELLVGIAPRHFASRGRGHTATMLDFESVHHAGVVVLDAPPGGGAVAMLNRLTQERYELPSLRRGCAWFVDYDINGRAFAFSDTPNVDVIHSDDVFIHDVLESKDGKRVVVGSGALPPIPLSRFLQQHTFATLDFKCGPMRSQVRFVVAIFAFRMGASRVMWNLLEVFKRMGVCNERLNTHLAGRWVAASCSRCRTRSC